MTTVPTLALSNVQPSNAGDYTVRTSNSCGTVSSAVPAVLQVDLPITGVTLAVSANPVCTGTNVTIAATPTGGTPSTYGWFRDGVGGGKLDVQSWQRGPSGIFPACKFI